MKKKITSFLSYLRYYFFNKKPGRIDENKIIVLHLPNPRYYNRYMYLFIKYFSIEGYTIYFPDFNYNTFKKYFEPKLKIKSNYFYLILQEHLMVLGQYPKIKNSNILIIDESILNVDYFNFSSSQSINKEHYYFPMTMHPLFYNKGIWKNGIKRPVKSKNSIFMIGSFNKDLYSGFDEELFKMPSRLSTLRYLKINSILSSVQSKKELAEFIDSNNDNQCIVIDSTQNETPMINLRRLLSCFKFYLVLPGVVMPFSHNLIEALSVGSIPLIHVNYADLLKPKLKHLHTAIIYKDLNDLSIKIKMAYSLNDQITNSMKMNILKYYHTHLTPYAVVNKIHINRYSKIFLPMEHYSVSLLQKDLLNKANA